MIMSKKKSNKGLPPEEKRNAPLSAKVTKAQKAYIKATAKKCKMTMSDYILARCFNYQPKARITPEQETLLAPLIEVRSDLRKFFAAFKGMPAKERDMLLRSAKFILEWLQLLYEVGTKISDVLDSLMRKNELPHATPKNEES